MHELSEPPPRHGARVCPNSSRSPAADCKCGGKQGFNAPRQVRYSELLKESMLPDVAAPKEFLGQGGRQAPDGRLAHSIHSNRAEYRPARFPRTSSVNCPTKRGMAFCTKAGIRGAGWHGSLKGRVATRRPPFMIWPHRRRRLWRKAQQLRRAADPRAIWMHRSVCPSVPDDQPFSMHLSASRACCLALPPYRGR